MDTKVLNQQSQHWEKNFSNKPEMFGLEPSLSAKKSLEIFKKNKITNILELGAGLGRDTIFFAQNSIQVHALARINRKAKGKYLHISNIITVVRASLNFKSKPKILISIYF